MVEKGGDRALGHAGMRKYVYGRIEARQRVVDGPDDALFAVASHIVPWQVALRFPPGPRQEIVVDIRSSHTLEGCDRLT